VSPYLFLTLIAAVAVPVQGARDFLSYTSRSNWALPAPEVERVGKLCGFKSEAATVVYATLYDDRWVRRRQLKNASDNAETDLFSTAEIWRSKEGQELFDLWSVSEDTVDEVETIGCVSREGFLQAVVITDTRTTPGDGHLEFRFNTEAEFTKSGQAIHKSAGFITYQGTPASAPQLEEEDRKALRIPLDPNGIAKNLMKIEEKVRKAHAA
jgi:hypothetical protein